MSIHGKLYDDEPRGYTFKDVISPDTTRNVELKRIADALDRIAKFLEDSAADEEELRKTIPIGDDDESYPASKDDIKVIKKAIDYLETGKIVYRSHELTPEDIAKMRSNPDPLDVAEEG